MRFADVFIRRPVFATMLVGSLVVLGLFSYRTLGLDLFPNIDFPIVTVTTTLKGASVEEMETGVTKLFIIEDGIAHEREVTLGVDLGDGWVEVATGIAAGKQVATSGLSKLANGTQVVVRTDVSPGA